MDAFQSREHARGPIVRPRRAALSVLVPRVEQSHLADPARRVSHANLVILWV